MEVSPSQYILPIDETEKKMFPLEIKTSVSTLHSGANLRQAEQPRHAGCQPTVSCLVIAEAQISALAKNSEPQEIMTCSMVGPTLDQSLQPERTRGCVCAEGSLEVGCGYLVQCG